MSTNQTPLDQELQILFGALCDGLRQEVRTRRLAHLVTGDDVSLTNSEREYGICAALAAQLKPVGFFAQVESYIEGARLNRRPDLRIWLPAWKKHLYLEYKTVGWGDAYRTYYYAGVWGDMRKLVKDSVLNGLLVVGFGKTTDNTRQLFRGCQQRIGKRIASDYPSYIEVGLEQIGTQGLNLKSSHAVVGLWVRKPS